MFHVKPQITTDYGAPPEKTGVSAGLWRSSNLKHRR
jgi:hypothetical protein